MHFDFPQLLSSIGNLNELENLQLLLPPLLHDEDLVLRVALELLEFFVLFQIDVHVYYLNSFA